MSYESYPSEKELNDGRSRLATAIARHLIHDMKIESQILGSEANSRKFPYVHHEFIEMKKK